MSTPVAGALAVTPLYATPSDAIVSWDDPGQTWRSLGTLGGAVGTVTSIAAGPGITVSPSPIVGAGSIALTDPVVVGQVRVEGAGNLIELEDRSNPATGWRLYADSTLRFYAISWGADRVTFSANGDVSVPGALTLGTPLAIASGGTGAATAVGALSNLGGAPLASPVFTGDPRAPTPATADNDTSIATTAFVKAQGYGTGSGTITGVTAGTGLTGGGTTGTVTLNLATPIAVANGGTGSSTVFTAGSVLFAGALGVHAQDNANLFWDDAANRLGLGTTSPGSLLTAGTPPTSAYTAPTVAAFYTTADTGQAVSVARGGVANPQTVRVGVSQASLYSEIQAYQENVGVNTLLLNRLGGTVGIGTGSPSTSYTLDVGGNARVNAGIVMPTGVAMFWGNESIIESGTNLQLRAGTIGFWNAAGSTTYGSIGSTGMGIGSTGITYTSYEGHSVAFGWTGSLKAYIDGTAVGNVTITSDYRVKDNVAPLASCWERVKALNPVRYTHKDYGAMVRADPLVRWGFIAHELQETLTESAATGHKDIADAIQSPEVFVVLAAVTRALQEAMVRIEALEGKL